MTTVRTLIVVSSSRKWNISAGCQKCFFNGDLNEEVFMTPPPVVSHKPGEVCQLKKALYGLKQAPCAWYEKFATVVTSLDKMVEDIPIDAKEKYTPTDGDPLPNPSLYRAIVGSLVYLTVTRLNISYAVHIVSQFVCAPITVH
ncbi:uncharacterized mitochondrial protein-like protein [Tanacetum coccineum]